MPTSSRKKQAKDSAVQGTNDSSVVSKLSAAARRYFHDDFLRHFVCKEARRAPLINRGYYVRWKAVDFCVRRFLHVTKNCPMRQILSLGAGFDSAYFRLHADGALDRAVVFEVDFPDVSRRKAALIASNVTLRDALQPGSAPPAGQSLPSRRSPMAIEDISSPPRVGCRHQLGVEAAAAVALRHVRADASGRSLRPRHAKSFPEAEFNPPRPSAVPGRCGAEATVPGAGKRARDNLCMFGGSFCLCTRGFEMWSLSSGLGAVRVSGYEPLLPRDGARGGETQGGEPGAV
uniref:Leucine carboxyl methyltransferase 2 n=1 Tax=Gasterosteus aculeatus aculeatus TaxID=481459 RepID=A0AAQ4PC36_GASAC